MLDKHLPGLKSKYIQTYGNAYGLYLVNQKAIYATLVKACDYYGIKYQDKEIYDYLQKFEDKSGGEQLSLF